MSGLDFLAELEQVIRARLESGGSDASYTARLAAAGIQRVAQKVGEEGVEVAIAAAGGASDAELTGEAADLVYHLAVLLAMRGLSLQDVAAQLAARHG